MKKKTKEFEFDSRDFHRWNSFTPQELLVLSSALETSIADGEDDLGMREEVLTTLVTLLAT